MLRIDFYVQHLVRHGATGVELLSGQPVTFEFPAGPRKSSKPIEHAQIAQLVQEAGPPEVLQQLRSSGRASFTHRGDAMNVSVNLQAKGPGVWRVHITPLSGAAAKDVGGELSLPDPVREAAPRAPERAPMAAQRPAPKKSAPPRQPNIQMVEGEPEINRLLRVMKAQDASDLHLSSDVVPMARIDGEMKPLGDTPLQHEDLTELIYEIMPERNKKEFDETFDSDFAHTIEGLCRFRANVFMDRKGIGGVFRQIPFEILSVEQIGLPKKVLDLCWLSKGLVLVTGPTGSGKSTTLATLIDYINQNRSDHIITIEDPIEFVHPNKKCLINQREVGNHTQSFKRALRAALREDPDIVLVGEMRDLETIAIAIETAETGHLVFGTLHTTSAPSTVDRIIDQFPPDQQEQIRVMLSESLRGVVAQVLCKKIGGGRVAGYEVLVTNAAVSNLIREGKTFQLKSVMQTGKKLGMQTMNDDLMSHVLEGRVSAEEAYIKSNDKLIFKEALKRNNIPLSITDDQF